jgi:hypothetical protein
MPMLIKRNSKVLVKQNISYKNEKTFGVKSRRLWQAALVTQRKKESPPPITLEFSTHVYPIMVK